jgi:hypothetical protein
MTNPVPHIVRTREGEDSPLWIEQDDGPPRALKWHEVESIPERWNIVTDLEGGKLSTAFLGYRTYGGHLYETAFFPDDPDAHVSILSRYRTRATAEGGHAAYVQAEPGPNTSAPEYRDSPTLPPGLD